MEGFKHTQELSLEFESVNIVFKTGKGTFIAGGDEGKLHLISEKLEIIKSQYIGACINAGICHNDHAFVAVKNQKHLLQIYHLDTLKLVSFFSAKT